MYRYCSILPWIKNWRRRLHWLEQCRIVGYGNYSSNSLWSPLAPPVPFHCLTFTSHFLLSSPSARLHPQRIIIVSSISTHFHVTWLLVSYFTRIEVRDEIFHSIYQNVIIHYLICQSWCPRERFGNVKLTYYIIFFVFLSLPRQFSWNQKSSRCSSMPSQRTVSMPAAS